MKANKWAIILTGVISIISIAHIFMTPQSTIIHEITLACFGSALLGVVVAFTAYRAERRAAMECFWEEAYEINRKIKNMEHLDFDAPEEMVYDALTEEFWNIGATEKRDLYYDWYKQNRSGSPEKTLIKCHETIYRIIDQYMDFAEINMRSISNAYGRLDFLFGNKTVRREAYDKIYARIRDFQNACLQESFHFELLIKGQGNLPVCIEKLKALDAKLYTKKENAVYRVLYNELERDLEDFRTKIYGAGPEHEDPIPVIIRFDKRTKQDSKETEPADQDIYHN